jgi:16S rRNA (adenine1518-N6/adenine1519-N6)-dimethyltransferase
MKFWRAWFGFLRVLRLCFSCRFRIDGQPPASLSRWALPCMLCPMSITSSPGAPTRPDYDSPKALSAYLDARELGMRKRYGQNFLVNPDVRRRVADVAEMSSGSLVWEIGPGLGAMTAQILDRDARAVAFEIDPGFSAALREIYGADGRFQLREGDFLKTWKAAWAEEKPDRILGNLPYNSAAAMVAALLEGGPPAERMVFTVQREAAHRMASSPGTKDYASFTVLCRSVCDVHIAFDIGSSAFWPAPRVTSSVILMTPRPNAAPEAGTPGFTQFVRSLFSSRRKTAVNNLRALGRSGPEIADVLRSLGFSEAVRAEALSPDELLAFYRAIGPN